MPVQILDARDDAVTARLHTDAGVAFEIAATPTDVAVTRLDPATQTVVTEVTLEAVTAAALGAILQLSILDGQRGCDLAGVHQLMTHTDPQPVAAVQPDGTMALYTSAGGQLFRTDSARMTADLAEALTAANRPAVCHGTYRPQRRAA